MKKWPKLLRFLWAFLLCGWMILLSIYASNGVDPIVKSLRPMVEGMPEVGLRTPMMSVMDAENACYSFYVELTGLPQGERYWLEGTLADKTGVVDTAGGELRTAEEQAGLWLRFSAESGLKTMRIAVFTDSDKTVQLYEDLAFPVFLTKSLPCTQEDLAEAVRPVTLSLTDQQAKVQLLFPVETFAETEGLQIQLIHESGAMGQFNVQSLTITEDVLAGDGRFEGIFLGENPYRVTAQQMDVELSFPRPPAVGRYHLQILDSRQAVLYTFENLLICDEKPVVEDFSWTEGRVVCHSEALTAAVQARLTAGAPEAFSVALYRGEHLLGVADQWRVEDVSGWRQGAVVTWQIPLEEPLAEQEVYRVEVTADVPFLGEHTAVLPPYTAEEWVLDAQNTLLDSRYFACFTIPSAGFQSHIRYRAELWEEGHLVAATWTSPDETGLFEIVFTTETGEPLPVKPGTQYRITLSRWAEGGWKQCASIEKLTANATGENQSDGVAALSLSAGGVRLHYGIKIDGEPAQQLTLQLFDVQNQTGLADCTLHWSDCAQAVIREGDLPARLAGKPLQAVAFVEGVPAAVFAPAYWLSEERAHTLAQGTTLCQVQVSCDENGSATLYCDGQPAEAGTLPALSELYLHAVPAAGYRRETLRVNQKPATGSALLLTEDTQVDMTFCKANTQTFAVKLEYDSTVHHVDGGYITVSRGQASVEDTVLLTAQVHEGHLLERLDVVLAESGLPIALTEVSDSWQFSMPGEAVRVIAAIRPLYHPAIAVEQNNEYGVVTAPETAVEGGTVTVQVVPHAASSLERLELVYQQKGREVRENLLSQPTGAHAYGFCVPAAEQLTLAVTFTQPPVYEIVDAATEYGAVIPAVSASVPTERVFLTVVPENGCRMVEQTLLAQAVVDGQLQVIPVETVDDRLSFVMPWGDVRLLAVFEPIPPSAAGCADIATGQQLVEALGGEQNARLCDHGTTVQLLRSVEVQSPLVFTDGALTLDVGTYTLSAAYGLREPPVQIQTGAQLTITGTDGGVDAQRAQQTALLLDGGGLTVAGGCYRGSCALQVTGESRLLLRGGSFAGERLALFLSRPLKDCLERHVTALAPETGAPFDALWTARTELADAVRFVQETPAFGAARVTAKRTETGVLTVTVPVEYATEDALLLAAVYDACGRLTGVVTMPCIRGADSQLLTLRYSDAPQTGQVFLLDYAAFLPQCLPIPLLIP